MKEAAMGWTRSWVLLAGVWVLLVGSECGTPISNSECEELYQGVEGFQLCDQTGSSCIFYRNNRPDPEISCEEICESAGAACLNAYNEGEPDVCSVGGELVCDESSCENACQVREGDSVCACGNASSGTGGTGGSGGFGGMGDGGIGDLGDTCGSTPNCDPNASDLGVFCCLDEALCGPNLGECVEECSTYSSGGVVGMVEDALCQDNSECGPGLFCCLAPGTGGNCDFELDQSCTCRAGP